MPSETHLATPPITRASIAYPRHRSRSKTGAAPWRWAARRRRLLLIMLAASQSVVAGYYLSAVLPYHDGTALEVALTATFIVNFAWISLGAWLAIFGFVIRRAGGDRNGLIAQSRRHALAAAPIESRTAIVMPLRNEVAPRALAGLEAVYLSIKRTGQLEHFDFYILSDSNDPGVWLAEQAGWAQLVRRLEGHGKVFYRRRRVPLRHKSGNIADFLRRWGKRYDYFVVLDADSIMEGVTLVRMVRLMQQYPRVGIVQSPPETIGARSLFARVQQFANRAYGALFTAGLAAVQLGDGSYWGHNAIIRTEPFMRHCGLASLRGFGLFRGPILSHDFVEAAYMRRAGYEVWLEPGLRGSYENTPPSLVDDLARDRRWLKGNLQHLALMARARGIGIAYRLSFLNGILNYATAAVWAVFLGLSALELVRFTVWPINYFPGGHHLIPVWPQWHPGWALRLAASTAFVLIVPKLMAYLDIVINKRRRRMFGGALRVTISIIIESATSVCLSPIRMLAHSHFLTEALSGLPVRWAGQNRGGEIAWWPAVAMHSFGMLVGIGWMIIAWRLRPTFFFWSLPIALPLAVAPAVSVLTSRLWIGGFLARHGLLVTAGDTFPAQVQKLFTKCGGDTLGEQTRFCPLSRILLDHHWYTTTLRFARRDRRIPDSTLQAALRDGPHKVPSATLAQLADNITCLTELRRRTADIDLGPWRSAALELKESEV